MCAAITPHHMDSEKPDPMMSTGTDRCNSPPILLLTLPGRPRLESDPGLSFGVSRFPRSGLQRLAITRCDITASNLSGEADTPYGASTVLCPRGAATAVIVVAWLDQLWAISAPPASLASAPSLLGSHRRPGRCTEHRWR